MLRTLFLATLLLALLASPALALVGGNQINYDATFATTAGNKLGINLGNANTWTAAQTFGANIVIQEPYGITLTSGADSFITGLADGVWINGDTLYLGKWYDGAVGNKGGKIVFLTDDGIAEWHVGVLPVDLTTTFTITGDQGSKRTFNIAKGAPTNSLCISDLGNVSLGTGADDGARTLQVAGDAVVKDYLRITAAGGYQLILMGNQDSGGANNPSLIRAANGNLAFGTGDSWSADDGGTMDATMTILDAGRVLIGTTTDDTVYKLQLVRQGSGLQSMAWFRAFNAAGTAGYGLYVQVNPDTPEVHLSSSGTNGADLVTYWGNTAVTRLQGDTFTITGTCAATNLVPSTRLALPSTEGDPANSGDIKINIDAVPAGLTHTARVKQNTTVNTLLSTRQTRTKEFTAPSMWFPTTIRDNATSRNSYAQCRMPESADSSATYTFPIPDDMDVSVAPTMKFLIIGGTSTQGNVAMRLRYMVLPHAAAATAYRNVVATTMINSSSQAFYGSGALTASDFATTPAAVVMQVERLGQSDSATDTYTQFTEITSVSFSYTTKE